MLNLGTMRSNGVFALNEFADPIGYTAIDPFPTATAHETLCVAAGGGDLIDAIDTAVQFFVPAGPCHWEERSAEASSVKKALVQWDCFASHSRGLR